MSETIRHSFCRQFFFSSLVASWRETNNAFWLIDLFATHYSGNKKFIKALQKDQRLRDLQIWTVKPYGNGCRIQCRADTNDPVVATQTVPYTDLDFEKLGEVKFYCGYTQVGSDLGFRMFLPEEY